MDRIDAVVIEWMEYLNNANQVVWDLVTPEDLAKLKEFLKELS